MNNSLPEDSLFSIGEISRILKVSIGTLRRWEKKGRIKPVRTSGGHRRYNLDAVRSVMHKKGRLALPSRVQIPPLEMVHVLPHASITHRKDHFKTKVISAALLIYALIFIGNNPSLIIDAIKRTPAPQATPVLGVESQGGSSVTFGSALDENFNLSLKGFVEGSQLRSTTATTSPLTVANTIKVTNLNVDLLDGSDWSDLPNLITKVNGNFDVGGSLSLSGNALTSSEDLSINLGGGDLVLADGDVINIGGSGADVAYNLIGDSVSGASSSMDSDDDLYIEGNLEVDGSITGTINGTINPGFSTGSVIFQGSSGLAQDNANFFWDDSTNNLGIGDNSPDAKLEILSTTEQLRLTNVDNTQDARFTVNSSGNLTITPTGGNTYTLASGYTNFNCTDCIDFDDLKGIALTLDESTQLAQTTFAWTQTFTGTVTQGYTYTANSLTSGTAIGVQTSATAFTGTLMSVLAAGNNAANTGTLFKTSSTGASSALVPFMATNLGTGISFRVNDETGDTDSTPFVIDATGSVGIGTATPASGHALDVEGQLQITLDGDAVTGEAFCGNQPDGDAADTANVTISDCSLAPSSDYMEIYSVEPDAETGDIVATSNEYITTTRGDRVTKLVKSTKEYQESAIGIVSNPEDAGDFNSIGYVIKEEDNPMPIALSGRVPVKVAKSSPSIIPGDFVTSSSEAGRAMKATKAGFVVGKALEEWSPESGRESVLVFVNNTYYQPPLLALDANGEIVVPNELSSSQEVITKNQETIASEYDALNTRLDLLETEILLLKSQQTLGISTAEGTNSEPLTTLEDVVVTGKLNVGSLVLDGSQHSLDALGTLKIQSLALGPIEFQAGAATLDEKGNLKIQKLTIDTSDEESPSIGTAKIPSGETEINISTTTITTESKVFTSLRSKTGSQSLIVTEVTPGKSFKVMLENSYGEDVAFDWWVVN